MVSALISRLVILVCGTLYPAYASYKAIRTKNVREYVKWMMYWIVFALFSAIETFSDVFLSWLPFYYEIKMIFVIWMLSPITKGSSYLYKKFVHPQLAKREKEIDEYISQATNKGYSTLLHLGQRGLTFATNVVVRTAVRGQTTLVDQIRKSYSTNDLRVPIADESVAVDSDEEFDNRLSEDNRELERRKDKRRLHRSASDVTDSRVQRVQKSATGLSSLEEEEENVEEEQIYTEEIIYRPRMNYTPKEWTRYNRLPPYNPAPVPPQFLFNLYKSPDIRTRWTPMEHYLAQDREHELGYNSSNGQKLVP